MFKKLQIILAAIFATLTLNVVPAFAATTFLGGNQYIVSNTNTPAWMDPVNANPGDIVQFKVNITNNGNEIANNVIVRADLPSNITGTALTSTIHVSGDNAAEMIDTATVNVPSGNYNLTYFPGHTVKVDNSGTTQLPDYQITTGINIGSVTPGASNYVEVSFKAQVVANAAITPTPTAVPTATPTPTPTITATPTPTMSVTPTPTPVQNVSLTCPSGATEVNRQSIGAVTVITCQQQNIQFTITNTNSATGGSSSSTSNSTSNATGGNVTLSGGKVLGAAAPAAVAGSSVSNVTQLPKTGLPIGAWVLGGLIPAGLGIKRFGKRNSINLEGPQALWMEREFKKSA